MRRERKTGAGIFIGLFITLLVAGMMSLKLSPLETLEDKLLDYRFKIRGKIKPPESIVIATIDEKSLERIGRWPWSRDKMTLLARRLTEAQAEIIVFDVIFSETEMHDPQFAAAIREAGNVIFPVVFEFERTPPLHEDDFLVNSAFQSILHHSRFNTTPPIVAKGILLPVISLGKEAIALGHINMLADVDGTLGGEVSHLYWHRGDLGIKIPKTGLNKGCAGVYVYFSELTVANKS